MLHKIGYNHQLEKDDKGAFLGSRRSVSGRSVFQTLDRRADIMY